MKAKLSHSSGTKVKEHPVPVDPKIIKTEQELMDRSYRLKIERPLRFLSPKEIQVIDEFLDNMGEDDELCLIVHKGRLRFVTHTKDRELSDKNQRESTSE
jgi:hypothetical protein